MIRSGKSDERGVLKKSEAKTWRRFHFTSLIISVLCLLTITSIYQQKP